MEALYEKIKEYGLTNVELLKFKAVDKTAAVVASAIARLVTFLFLLMFLLSLNVAVALWIGFLLGKTYYGFLIMAGFYCVGGIIMHLFLRDWLKKRIRNSLINKMLN